jgi:hypothetical protein
MLVERVLNVTGNAVGTVGGYQDAIGLLVKAAVMTGGASLARRPDVRLLTEIVVTA